MCWSSNYRGGKWFFNYHMKNFLSCMFPWIGVCINLSSICFVPSNVISHNPWFWKWEQKKTIFHSFHCMQCMSKSQGSASKGQVWEVLSEKHPVENKTKFIQLFLECIQVSPVMCQVWLSCICCISDLTKWQKKPVW